MKITVIGAGYVGLVSAACFSDFGYEVTCVDRDARKEAALENGKIPIYEQGLEPVVASNHSCEVSRSTLRLGLRLRPEQVPE